MIAQFYLNNKGINVRVSSNELKIECAVRTQNNAAAAAAEYLLMIVVSIVVYIYNILHCTSLSYSYSKISGLKHLLICLFRSQQLN